MATVSEDERALDNLRFHWGDEYTISFADGQWSARHHGTAEPLTATTSERLRKLIWDDYFARIAPGPADQGSL